MYSPTSLKQQPFSTDSKLVKQRAAKSHTLSKHISQPSAMDWEAGSYYEPKTWDFAYSTGRAPPSSTPHLQAVDQPRFCSPATPIEDEYPTPSSTRKPSATSSESSSTSTSSSSNATQTLATPPETPKSPTFLKKFTEANAGLDSMPTWARSLPKEVFAGGSLRDRIVLFPTNSTPRSAVEDELKVTSGGVFKRRMKGINRPGHPTLKLGDCERDDYRDNLEG